MKVYVCGPMTGIRDWNFPAFDEASAFLRDCGYAVINPADLDRNIGFQESQRSVSGDFMRHAMRRDLSAICECDGVAVLENWQASLGACIEVALAVRLGLKVIDAGTLEDITADTAEYVRWRMTA